MALNKSLASFVHKNGCDFRNYRHWPCITTQNSDAFSGRKHSEFSKTATEKSAIFAILIIQLISNSQSPIRYWFKQILYIHYAVNHAS